MLGDTKYKLSLTKNMKVDFIGGSNVGHFSELLLRIIERKHLEFEGKFTLPPGLGTVESTLTDLIEKIYFGIKNLKDKSIDWLCERANIKNWYIRREK